ncbi:MAG: AAA domain-containing protein [Candidatus Pseudobacter hemicellulosilyticus]|uniref:AAA domain-containing protein n=1 Tax=Candidatus Pseudobacter hemicellulosilyticus TaxID=3121375 RepID=A0AAJ5WR08_9BACT|nr:MAG: AAA domain-containing protein [Pseudobacter sp.]
MDYFKKLQALLQTERREDEQLFRQQHEILSVSARRANGLSWYPIAIRDTEMSRGDYLTVEVERTTHQELPHLLRFGAAAALFSNHDPEQNKVEGIITHVGGNKLKLTLRTDELPDWSRDGKLGIDLLFDDNSYDEMQAALKQAMGRVEKREEGQLIRVLTGSAEPGSSTDAATVSIPRLNAGQQAAVNTIIAANDLAIVHGPPGTGKTTTLVQAIKALINLEPQRILVVAPSNTAVDLLSEKLSEEGLNVLRVGNPNRVSERLQSLTLENKMAAHASNKEIKKLKRQANEYRDMAHKYKRHFGKAEREQRKALFDEARKIGREVEATEQYILKDLLSRAQVVTATLVGANHYTVRDQQYHTVVIDEAGQALEPACWIPILKARKLVLAGDHCQLPPTVKSADAARNGLSTTLLEKAVALQPGAVTLLEEQYRMHEAIMGFSSAEFYEGRLLAHASVAQRMLFAGDKPLSFVDTAGCGFEEKTEGTAISNPEEAAFLLKHLTGLVRELDTHYSIKDFPSIGIISPYRLQIEVLKELILHNTELLPYAAFITVNTIDSFQGQERDIVYIGLTRSNADNRIGFLSEVRRMNVAMTRARKKLVVIGDSATLSQSDFYADFIGYAEKQEAYLSAWEFMDI